MAEGQKKEREKRAHRFMSSGVGLREEPKS